MPPRPEVLDAVEVLRAHDRRHPALQLVAGEAVDALVGDVPHELGQGGHAPPVAPYGARPRPVEPLGDLPHRLAREVAGEHPTHEARLGLVHPEVVRAVHGVAVDAPPGCPEVARRLVYAAAHEHGEVAGVVLGEDVADGGHEEAVGRVRDLALPNRDEAPPGVEEPALGLLGHRDVARQAVELVDHEDVVGAGLAVGDAAPEGGALVGAAGNGVVAVGLAHLPALAHHEALYLAQLDLYGLVALRVAREARVGCGDDPACSRISHVGSPIPTCPATCLAGRAGRFCDRLYGSYLMPSMS